LRKVHKNPKGGLTAAGRAHYRKQGSNLKPGVKNYNSASSGDKARWVNWATRFYSNPKGPMVKDGKPTRLALMATAWGQPVPKTREAAQAIAAKARARSQTLKKMRQG
jgi:hypothetical protein